MDDKVINVSLCKVAYESTYNKEEPPPPSNMNADVRKHINQQFSAKLRTDKGKKERKRKLAIHGDDSDDMSSEDDDDDFKKRPTVTKGKRASPLEQELDTTTDKKQRTEEKSLSEVYRDRARERREGKNLDHLDLDVQHEVQQPSIRQTAAAIKLNTSEADHPSSDKQDQDPRVLPIETLLSKIQSSTCSDVGKGVLSYLQHIRTRQHKDATTIDRSNINSSIVQPKSIPKTIMSFSLNANIHIPSKSWETPKETTLPRQTHEADSRWKYSHWTNQAGIGSTPLDMPLIQKIKHALQSKNTYTHNKLDVKPNTQNQHESKIEQSDDDDDNDNDDDDDIFSGLGEYVPTTIVSTCNKQQQIEDDNHEEAKNPAQKIVIFQEVEPTPNTISKEIVPQLYAKTNFDERRSFLHRTIDPSVLTLETDSSQRGKGIPMDSIGNYGEEMDMDFDGSLEAELQLKGGKRRGKANKSRI